MMVKRGEVWRKPSVSYDLRTDNWERIQQWCRHPEQRLYESIRPITLYGVTPAERASETNLPERTLRRTADSFDSLGVASLFRPTMQQREDHHRSLPVPMRQRARGFEG